MFGKAHFCKRSSAVVLQLWTCPLAFVGGMEPHLLSELFDCQQRGVKSYFLSDAEGFVLVVETLPVFCCCMIFKSFNFRCDGGRTDLALKRASRSNFRAFFTH